MVRMRPGGRGPALLARRARHARPETKAMNAATVEHAGTEKFLMSHTRNTNVRAKLQDPAALVRAPSTKIHELHEAWARERGYRKQQAASRKRQAPSFKPQALTIQKSQAN